MSRRTKRSENRTTKEIKKYLDIHLQTEDNDANYNQRSTFDNQQPVLFHQSCNNDDCYLQLENNDTDDVLVINDCNNICEHATINTSDEINLVSSDTRV